MQSNISSCPRPRLLTGDRPTGPLHLGHLVGSLRNRVTLQHDYDCFFIIADLHMLTTKGSKEDIGRIRDHARVQVLDALATGIDPEKATFYLQSAIPEIHEIAGLFQGLVSVSRVSRLPALKDMARAADTEMSLALLGYPVLQSADILSVRANAVPVGKDNFAFVEITREIARRFNTQYGEIFPVPDIVASDIPTLIGTDGTAKMSKSLGNAINLSDTPAEVRRKVMRMYTDLNRVRADIPGKVEGNPVFDYLDAFGTDRASIEEMKDQYREGRIGDVEVKQYLIEVLEGVLSPMRERREQFSEPGLVERLIIDGSKRVRAEAIGTVREMKRAMGLTSTLSRIRRSAERHASTGR